MKLFALTLLGLMLAVTGCVIRIGGRDAEPRHEVVQRPAPPPPMATEDKDVMMEIDAAGRLDLEPMRANLLKGLAARPNTSPAVQVHLVDTTFQRLSLEPFKVQVLQTIIANPSFSTAAKESILRQLDQLSLTPYKNELLTAIQKRAEGR